MKEDAEKIKLTLEALKEFDNLGAWSGSVKERKDKYTWLCEKLKVIYDKPNLRLVFDVDDKISNWYGSGDSYYRMSEDVICLIGRLSVITFLHEFAHAIGLKNQDDANKFARGFFKEVFPLQWAKLSATKDKQMMERERQRRDVTGSDLVRVAGGWREGEESGEYASRVLESNEAQKRCGHEETILLNSSYPNHIKNKYQRVIELCKNCHATRTFERAKIKHDDVRIVSEWKK